MAAQELGELREIKKRDENQRDGLESRLQRAQRYRGNCCDGASRVQCGVDNLQNLKRKD